MHEGSNHVELKYIYTTMRCYINVFLSTDTLAALVMDTRHPKANLFKIKTHLHRTEEPRVLYKSFFSLFVPLPMDTQTHKRPRTSTASMQYSDVLTSTANNDRLPFDSMLLGYYNVQIDLANPLSNLIQAQFIHGNQLIRDALSCMVYSMLARVQEHASMENEISRLLNENQDFRQQIQDLHNRNETLEAEAEDIPRLQVYLLVFVDIFIILTVLFQTKLSEVEKNYSDFVELSKELQNSAYRSEELAAETDKLKAQLREHARTINTMDLELKAASLRLKCLDAGMDKFKDSANEYISFPVMQSNGHMVDFYKILSVWAKSADDDENHQGRGYACPTTRRNTTLAPFQITQHIQTIATSLGVHVETPLKFEWEEDSEWKELGVKTQIQLAARVCYIYANRKRNEATNNILMAEEHRALIVFKMTQVFFY